MPNKRPGSAASRQDHALRGRATKAAIVKAAYFLIALATSLCQAELTADLNIS